MMTYKYILNQTVRKYEIRYGGIKWQTTANGGILRSEQEMNECIPGRFYTVVLPENHSELGIKTFSLICVQSSEVIEGSFSVNQIAFGIKSGVMKLWLRNGEISDTINFELFSELSSGGGVIDESDPVFTNWLANTPPVLVQDNKISSADTTAVTVGGLAAGTNLQNKTPLEVLDLILYPELFQQASGIVAPSLTFTITPSGLQEVGASVNIVKTKSFNRGSISPQYQSSSPYRSGALVDYTESGVEGAYTVVLGVQNWTCKANYDIGVQPKGSKGTNTPGYSALPAGSTSVITRTITGVYPIYATTANISLLTKQSLLAHGSDIDVNQLVAESGGNKQTVRIPQAWGAIAHLYQYNPFGQWDAISLATFTKTAVQVTVNGNTVDYWEYVHNGSTIGARRLKFTL